tara:strand:+ start:577 stop:684 length:108 start_codon:yes stop_codon:yes gene_type:complete
MQKETTMSDKKGTLLATLCMYPTQTTKDDKTTKNE